MLYPVALQDTHMVLRLVLASIRNKQATLNASIPVMKYRLGKLGYRIASQLYCRRLNSSALPFHPAANILDRVLRLMRRRSSEHLILTSFLILNSALWKQTRFRLNATEIESAMFLLGLMTTQVCNSTWDAWGVCECLPLVHFSDLCEVTADVAAVKKSTWPQLNLRSGATYYTLKFDVVLLFGLTELKAQIAWIENVSRSPDLTIELCLTLCNREKKNGTLAT
jgi:hypothetical protein